MCVPLSHFDELHFVCRQIKHSQTGVISVSILKGEHVQGTEITDHGEVSHALSMF